MSRVIPFSLYFPAYHPRKGEPTYFVEKLSIGFPEYTAYDYTPLKSDPDKFLHLLLPIETEIEFEPKFHTIRSGKRWKAGDMFSPRVWSGAPYCSPQITIAPDIEVKRVFDFKIKVDQDCIYVLVDGCVFYEENGLFVTNIKALTSLAAADGLTLEDFKAWFKWGTPFDGQIICWDDSVYY